MSSSSRKQPSQMPSSGLSTQPRPRGPRKLSLEIDGLYVLLSEQKLENQWHWGLYHHYGDSFGWVMHVKNQGSGFFYEGKPSQNIIYSDSLVFALQIASVPPDMQEALRKRTEEVPLEYVPRFGELTCRTWLLRVVEELDNEGYISLQPGTSVKTIETEASDTAARLSEFGKQAVKKSSFSKR